MNGWLRLRPLRLPTPLPSPPPWLPERAAAIMAGIALLGLYVLILQH